MKRNCIILFLVCGILSHSALGQKLYLSKIGFNAASRIYPASKYEDVFGLQHTWHQHNQEVLHEPSSQLPSIENSNLTVNISTMDVVEGLAAAVVNTNDSLVLVELYNATGGEYWVNNTNWLSGSVSTWYGIDVENERVTSIVLQSNNLEGVIPEQLAELDELVTLALGDNQLFGNIPSNLGSLTKLSLLYLWGNQLSGQIPPELGNIETLVKLALSSNEFTGSIPSELGDLVNLDYLSLANNSLTGVIPTTLGDLQNLVYLSLSQNGLAGAIPVEIWSLQKLTNLYLWSNDLSGSIESEIGDLVLSQEIDLSGNQLTGEIPSEIGNLADLTYLSFSRNLLSGTIPSALGSLSKLQHLYLNNNQLSGVIPVEIGGLTSLINLYLWGNNLSGSIPSELGLLTNVANLILARNQLSGEIPSQISSLTSLQELNLNQNELSGQVPVELSTLTSLNELDLGKNYALCEPEDEGYMSWVTTLNFYSRPLGCPSAVAESDSLALVVLYNGTAGEQWNNDDQWLEGPVAHWNGITVTNDGKIDRISLFQNNLVGTIPTEIGELTDLTYLDLAGNQLTGTIPDEVYQLFNLTELWLGDNLLTGVISTSIGDLTNLTNLYLYVNELTGDIPVEIGNLENLTRLSLYGNQLTGNIPPEIGNLTNLTVLSLRDNHLEGEIPEEIGNLTMLQYLYLARNQLSGEVPYQLGDLTSLQYLYLEDNELRYIIQYGFDELLEVNVSNNRFFFEHLYGLTDVNVAVLGPQKNYLLDQEPNLTEGDQLYLAVDDRTGSNRYQWYKDGAEIPDANEYSYSVNNVDKTVSGDYHLEVSNTEITGFVIKSEVKSITVNSFPIIADVSFTLTENSPNGTVVGQVEATDPDGDDFTYKIIYGNIAGAFEIDENTGVLTVSNGTVLDYENIPEFNLGVEVADASGKSDVGNMRILLSDVSDGALSGSCRLSKYSDDFGFLKFYYLDDQLVYSISDNDDSKIETSFVYSDGRVIGATQYYKDDYDQHFSTFEILYEGSRITQIFEHNGLNDDLRSSFFYENNQLVEVRTDYLNSSDNYSFYDGYKFVWDGEVIASESYYLAPNQTTPYFTTTYEYDDKSNPFYGDVAILLSEEFFDFTRSLVPFNVSFEEDGYYSSTYNYTYVENGYPVFADVLDVELRNGEEFEYTINFTYEFCDLQNYPPTISNQTFTIDENTANSTLVGQVVASDEDGDELTFSILSGNTNDAFALSTTGDLTVQTSTELDFETTPTFNLEVEVNDGNGGIAQATITVNLNDVDESSNTSPTIANQTFSVDENTANSTLVGQIVASDDDGDDLTFLILSGNMNEAFALSTTGDLTVQTSSELDFETAPSFSLEVEVNDGNGGTAQATITVNLNDVFENNPPTIADQTFTIDENSANETTVGSIVASDDDGDDLTFSILTGNINDAFALSTAGELTVQTSTELDYETIQSFSLEVEVSDGNGGTASATITVNLEDVDESTNTTPTIANQTFIIDENRVAGTIVGEITASDIDGDDLSFTINNGNLGTAFSLDASTGRLSVANQAALDYETTPTFSLEVEVDDGNGGTATATITINLNDVDEANNVSPVLADAVVSLDENTSFREIVVYLEAQDEDDSQLDLQYSITQGNISDAFAIGPFGFGANIVTNNVEALDYEINSVFNLVVTVDDRRGGVANADITINLNDINESAVASNQTFQVSENLAIGTVIGTIEASDPEEDVLTFAIQSKTSDMFVLDALTGAFSIAEPINFETAATQIYGVNIVDESSVLNVTITIQILDENDVPTISSQTFVIDENSTSNTFLGTIVASDEDEDDLTFSILSGNTNNAFALSTAGELTVQTSSALDFENTPTFSLEVEASDGSGGIATATITVNLNDLDENTPPTIADQTFSIDENSTDGTSVGSILASDDDGDDLTFSILSGNTNDAFALSTIGELTVQTSTELDFETTPTFNLVVEVNDGNGGADQATLTINLNDVFENTPPTIANQAFSIDENSANGTLVRSVVASDDDGDELTFSILSGNTNDAFALSTTGELTVQTSTELDFETTPTFNLEVEVNDGNGGTATATIIVNLNDVDETILIENTFQLPENSSAGTVIGAVGNFELGTELFPYLEGNSSQIDQNDEAQLRGIELINAGAIELSSNNFDLVLTSGNALDFESFSSFKVIVKLCCFTAGSEPRTTITVDVLNVNESTTIDDQMFSIDENSLSGTLVGQINASDEDEDDLTFSILSGNTNNAFALSTTGELVVRIPSELDFETTPTFGLEVEVNDGNGGTDQATITINLNDVDETPPLSVQEAIQVSVFPNPTSGKVTLKIPDHLVGEELYIVDFTGRKIFLQIISDLENEVDLSMYSSGLYLLKVGTQTIKLTKAE